MSAKLGKEFDIQDYLINTEKDPKAFFKACIEEDPGDGSLFRGALIELAKARGMAQPAGDRPFKKVFVQGAQFRRLSKIRNDI